MSSPERTPEARRTRRASLACLSSTSSTCCACWKTAFQSRIVRANAPASVFSTIGLFRLQRGQERSGMSGYSVPSREDDPIHTVRTIGRIAQMIIELRDEYVRRPRPDILQQIEQRLDDLISSVRNFRSAPHMHVRTSRHSHDAAVVPGL